jgi:hypothetical protein
MAATATPIVEQHLTTAQWEDPTPGTPQHKYIHSWRRENLFVGGRGTRKTAHLIYKCALQAMVLNAGQYESILTEQIAGDLDDILLPRLKKFINPDLYRIKGAKGGYDIHWMSGHLTRLRSRKAKRIHDDPPFRGPDAVFIGHDEPAMDKAPTSPERNVIAISAAMLRGAGAGAGRVRSMDFTTTPRSNWFYKYFQGHGVAANGPAEQISTNERTAAFYAKTIDTDPELHHDLISTGAYSPDLADQELFALWVSMLGRVFKSYKDARYPDGNRWNGGFDPERPWCLGIDLGSANCAWILVQFFRDPVRPSRRVAVCVAEWMGNQMGSFHLIPIVSRWLEDKGAKYKSPFKICIGHDLATGGNPGDSSEDDFLEAGGVNTDPVLPGDWRFRKSAQHAIVSRAIFDTTGWRQFCVSEQLESFHPGGQPGRGVHDMAMNFTMPERDTSAYFKKGAEDSEGYCHVADALCYLCAILFGDHYGLRTDRRPA